MSTSTQRILCFFLSVFMMTSCGKEDVRTNPNPGSYIRLETIGMEVTPKDREVEILFRATDFDHQGVSGITVEDLDVFENGGSIDQEGDLTISRNSIPFKLKTVLLLDLTRSVEGLVPQIKAACIAMINQKLSNQEIAIYTFDANTILLQDFTANKDALITAINNIPETDLVNSTNLYGAIQQMEDLWDDVYSIQGIEDGSLIVFTDGRHNATDPTPFENTLRVEVRNNTNSRSDAFLEETFNSEGFGN